MIVKEALERALSALQNRINQAEALSVLSEAIRNDRVAMEALKDWLSVKTKV